QGPDGAPHGAGDENLADAELAVHLAGLAHDQVPFRLHQPGQLAVDAERGVEAQLPLEMTAAVQKPVEVPLLPFRFEDHRLSPRSISTSKSRISSSSEWKWMRSCPPLPCLLISTRVCRRRGRRSSAAAVWTSTGR